MPCDMRACLHVHDSTPPPPSPPTFCVCHDVLVCSSLLQDEAAVKYMRSALKQACDALGQSHLLVAQLRYTLAEWLHQAARDAIETADCKLDEVRYACVFVCVPVAVRSLPFRRPYPHASISHAL